MSGLAGTAEQYLRGVHLLVEDAIKQLITLDDAATRGSYSRTGGAARQAGAEGRNSGGQQAGTNSSRAMAQVAAAEQQVS